MITDVWAYLVVSTEEQSDTLSNQEAWAKDTAEAKGWRLTRVFKGAKSGRHGVRALFDEMFQELKRTPEDQRPRYILLTRLDRIGRGDMVLAQVALREVHELGTGIWSREGGEVKLDKATDQLIAAVKLVVSAQENEVRVDKAEAEYERRRKLKVEDPSKAVSNVLAYGLKFENGHMVPNEPAASMVRQVFEMRAAGQGCHLIGKDLRNVAPPWVYKDGREKRMAFDADFLSRMFKKRSYVDAGLIDEVTWQRAQRNDVKQGGRKSRKHEYPLVGAVRCECGTSLMGQHAKPRNSDYWWYTCRDRKHVHGQVITHPKAHIEAQFVELMKMLGKNSAMIAALQNQGRDDTKKRKMYMVQLTTLKGLLGQIRLSRERVWDAFDAGDIPSEMLQGRLDALSERESKIRRDVADAEAELTSLNARAVTTREAEAVVLDADERWANATFEERRALAKRVAAVCGGALIITVDGTFELASNIVLSRFTVRARLRLVRSSIPAACGQLRAETQPRAHAG